MSRILNKFLDRAYLVLLSVYLYNEYQGFTQLEQLQEAFAEKYPDEKEMIEAIAKHASDEKKHYLMFQSYFEKTNIMPLSVGFKTGYVDLFIKLIFRKPMGSVSPRQIIHDEKMFYQLCRMIMMTERRGLQQVQWLLRTQWIKRHPVLTRIFRVVEKDEPSHFLPYQHWLMRHHQSLPTWREKLADLWVHYTLVYLRVPLLYLNLLRPRMAHFPYQ